MTGLEPTRWRPGRFAARPVLLPAAGAAILLAALAARYGYHRDEMYFIEAGYHPAWSYPDQPALVPLLARGWYTVVGTHLWLFRLVPALLAAAIVIVAGLTCAELGGDRRAQLLAALATATSTTVLAAAHLFSTTTFDAAFSTTSVWLLARALHRRTPAGWLLLGLVVGAALNVKLLPGIVLACCVLALLAVGPRDWVRSPWPYLAALLALLLAAPALLWQQAHGWPEIAVATSIAAGNSASSVSRQALVPLQVTLTGPVTCWLLIWGVIAGWRTRPHRWLPLAYLLLLVVLVVTGGKPYYALGLLPALLALASIGVAARIAGRPRSQLLVGVLLALNLIGGVLLTLPVVPARDSGYANAVNTDIGATIGWPRMVSVVRLAYQQLPAADRSRAVIVTSNYGEAADLALARRRGADLPPVYSGHNAFGEWGPPPAGAGPVLWVGWTDDPAMTHWFAGPCRRIAAVDTPWMDNEERGATVSLCQPAEPWTTIWPQLAFLG